MYNPTTSTMSVAPNGGITIAYQFAGDKQIEYALAMCAKSDAYCKRLGRAKASGRLNSSHYRQTLAVADNNNTSAVDALLKVWAAKDGMLPK